MYTKFLQDPRLGDTLQNIALEVGKFAFVNRIFFTEMFSFCPGLIHDSNNQNNLSFIVLFLLNIRFDKGWSAQNVILYHFI